MTDERDELGQFAKQGRGIREVLQGVEDALMHAGYDDFVWPRPNTARFTGKRSSVPKRMPRREQTARNSGTNSLNCGRSG